MGNKILLIIIFTFFVFNLSGCGAKKANITEKRYLATGLLPRESIVILQSESSNILSEDKEHSIETCMKTSMNLENPEINIVPSKDFRKALFPGKKFDETPHTEKALILFLQDEKMRHQVQKLGIRYLIGVGMTTQNSKKNSDFTADGGGGGAVLGIGQTWTRSSYISAFIIDVNQSATTGELASSSYGTAGFIFPVVIIIPVIVPLPPVPLISMTESEACSALGKAVMTFIKGQGELPVK